jgi:hypothetical protein
MVGLAGGILAWTSLAYGAWAASGLAGNLGLDFTLYLDTTRGMLAGEPLYPAVQLAGPYAVDVSGRVLYPPVTMLLFVPFTVLPALLWWVIPLTLTGAALWRLRPRPWAWPVMALLVSPPAITLSFVVWGNPLMWEVAFLSLGMCWGWPAALVLLKPTLAPFALVGIRTRGWWVAFALLAIVSVLMLPLWLDWVQVMLNARGPKAGLWYSLNNLPAMLIPVVAWLGSDRVAVRARDGSRSAPAAGRRLGVVGRDQRLDHVLRDAGRPASRDQHLDDVLRDAGSGDGRRAECVRGDERLDDVLSDASAGHQLTSS